MGPIQATIFCMTHPFRFRGRARPGEYWWFTLMLTIAYFVIGMVLAWPLLSLAQEARAAAATGVPFDVETRAAAQVEAMLTSGHMVAFAIFSLWASFATIAVTVRRLHDIGRSGWWYWISLVPFVGWLILLVMLCMPGEGYRNEFGPAPVKRGGRAAMPDDHRDSPIPEVSYGATDAPRTAEDYRALRHARMGQ
ncbi:MAG: DUF805 domain-containing protein [Pseudomonadota bacterium]